MIPSSNVDVPLKMKCSVDYSLHPHNLLEKKYLCIKCAMLDKRSTYFLKHLLKNHRPLKGNL